jgi:hypothetical protein
MKSFNLIPLLSILLLALLDGAVAIIPKIPLIPLPPGNFTILPPPAHHSKRQEATFNEPQGSAFFPQWIDHSNHSLGTFDQVYWWNTQFWKGPGSPIVLFTPGEAAADQYGAYLSEATFVGYLARQMRAGIVMLEREFVSFSDVGY